MSTRKKMILLLVPGLLLLTLLAGPAWVLHTGPGARWALNRVQAVTEGQLTWDSAAGNLGSGLKVSRISYLDDSVNVRSDELLLIMGLDFWPPTVQVRNLHLAGLDINLLDAGASATGPDEASLPQVLKGLSPPLKVIVDDFRVAGLKLSTQSDGELFQADSLLASVTLHDSLLIDRFKLDTTDEQLSLSGKVSLYEPFTTELDLGLAPASGSSLRGSVNGELDSLDISVDGLLAVPGFDTLKIDLSGRRHGDQVELERLSVTGDALTLSAMGTVSFYPEPALALQAQIDRIDPSAWVSDWPETYPMSGNFELGYETGGEQFIIDIPALDLRIAGTEARIEGNGIIDLQAGQVDGEVSWSNLDWPPGSASPDISSEAGHLKLGGTADDWRASGEIDLLPADLPRGRLLLDGHGDRNGARAHILDSSILGGSVSGQLEFNWNENSMPWTASLLTAGIDPAALFSDWPGSLDMELNASGQGAAQQFELDILSLSGTLRNRVVSGRGRLESAEGTMQFDGLQFSAGKSSIRLDGALQDDRGLAFEADIDSLEWLLGPFMEGVAGRLQGEGVVSWGPHPQVVRLNLDGTDLHWNDFAAQSLAIHSKPGPVVSAIVDLVIDATQLSLGEQTLETIRLDLMANTDRQELTLDAESGGNRLHADLNGALDDWYDPLDGVWTGKLHALDLASGEQLALALETPADLVVSASQASIREACLTGTQAAQLCLEAAWSETGGTLAEIQLDAVPLSLAGLFFESELEYTQILEGDLRWLYETGKKPSGSARINISPGTIQYRDDPQDGLATSAGLILFQLKGGQLSSGKFDIGFPGAGLIDIDFNIADVVQGTEAGLDGRAIVKLDHIEQLAGLVPYVDQASGRIEADLDISGKLGAPRIGGNILLIDAAFEHQATGLKLRAVDLEGQVYEDRHAELRGSFIAGDGKAEVFASADVPAMTAEMAITGKNLKLVDVPDLTVIADPDFRLGWHAGILEVNGSLFIPSARIAPRSLPAAVAVESPDLVIVAGVSPETRREKSLAESARIRGSLDVSLGDEVTVDLEMAQARMGGSVNFQWQDNLVPVANGNYTLAGRVQAYGQRLNITEGRISFPGIPADNPHLNIRAERDIYGNTQIRTAGIFVAGTLRRPAIEAYTIPMTNKDRAQTLLVTGSDFSYEQGVGAVDVGMYIAPKLYISYGIGLFDNENVVSARYDLKKGFGIKATSGQTTTGLDMSYTIER